ncbi:MAG TPA: MBL fold metallo-hydrolase, partial [Candidatus Elarobacter sp.]|nr:MBL fold metallo-hydrolase [Candidatus Elarobacter sp.]
GLEIGCTPAQHFSGRRPNNRNETLWCGWTIRAGDRAIYFAGDTARHPEFAAITRALGPFDAALLPIGAYDPRWFMRPVHMDPEEAVSAYRDIAESNGGRACTFVAMHWGTFRLTDEPLDEPPRITRDCWTRSALPEDRLWIPRHGETRRVAGEAVATARSRRV